MTKEKAEVKRENYYGTRNEINFIKGIGLGTWSKSHRVTNISREELLRRYLESCWRRERWGSIDQAKVIDFTRGLLASI